MSNSFDFEQFKANAIEQLKAGVPLSGKDGVLVPLLENLLNSALEGEMDSHLEGGERELSNRRHGHMSKHVQTSMGEVTINTPRDRDGTFNPQVVRKREKILADSLTDRIIDLKAQNTVEGYQRQFRKVTKNKGVFTSDIALEKRKHPIKYTLYFHKIENSISTLVKS